VLLQKHFELDEESLELLVVHLHLIYDVLGDMDNVRTQRVLGMGMGRLEEVCVERVIHNIV